MEHVTDWGEGPTWGRRYFRRCKKGFLLQRPTCLFLFLSPLLLLPRIVETMQHWRSNCFHSRTWVVYCCLKFFYCILFRFAWIIIIITFYWFAIEFVPCQRAAGTTETEDFPHKRPKAPWRPFGDYQAVSFPFLRLLPLTIQSAFIFVSSLTTGML